MSNWTNVDYLGNVVVEHFDLVSQNNFPIKTPRPGNLGRTECTWSTLTIALKIALFNPSFRLHCVDSICRNLVAFGFWVL
ncbi:hypothetical protein SUGI_0861300 [Cryptomeria japonica]|nr:hypothetical protein SUGI_0861300 [Cryptomeria japonica]